MEHAASLVLVGGLMVTALQTSRATSQSPVFKADVPSVEVDARVTDKHHQFVRDLQRADFVLLDDGRPQTITTFALVDIPREQWSPAAHNGAAASEGAESVAHPGGGRTYVILIDTVHIDAARARATSAAATLFVERYLFSNDQASIVCIGASTPAEITSDREKLKRDVARCTDRGNPLLGVGTTDNHEQAVHAAVMTMRGVATIATALGRISERRKAIVLFSQGIDLDYTNLKKFPDALESVEATQEAAAAATAANATIYAIDPRGSNQSVDNGIEVRSLPQQPSAMEAQMDQRDAMRRSQDNLRSLSDQTGGFATVNQHDLSRGFDRIVDESSAYYLLGFTAGSDRRDGKPHKIQVKVNRRDVDVQGNRSYVLSQNRD